MQLLNLTSVGNIVPKIGSPKWRSNWYREGKSVLMAAAGVYDKSLSKSELIDIIEKKLKGEYVEEVDPKTKIEF